MKFITLSIFLCSIIFGAGEVHATVGGPTFIYNLRTNAQAKEIVYDLQSMSGRGCPPVVFSLNLETGAETSLVDCDALNYDEAYNSTLATYPVILKRVNLPYNQITAKVTVTGEVKEDSQNFIGKTDFNLDIFQSDKKIASFAYSGCYANQPHIVEGYQTPNGTIAAIIVSTIGDCFEGGYTMEQVHLVSGLTTFYEYPLEPRTLISPATVDADSDMGNILVIAEKESGVNVSVLPYHIIIGILVLVVIIMGWRLIK